MKSISSRRCLHASVLAPIARLTAGVLCPARPAASGACRRPAGHDIPWSRFSPSSRIEITLGRLAADDRAVRHVEADPHRKDPAVFAPCEPEITELGRNGAAAGLSNHFDILGVRLLRVRQKRWHSQYTRYHIYKECQQIYFFENLLKMLNPIGLRLRIWDAGHAFPSIHANRSQ